MRRVFLIVLVALLVLPIVILPLSSYDPDRVNEQNSMKDFEISEYSTSTDHATSGSFAGTGEANTWESTFVAHDWDAWFGDAGCTLSLNFTITGYTYEFDYHFYGMDGHTSGAGDVTLEAYNLMSEAWDILDTGFEGLTQKWYNDTVTDSEYMDTTNEVVMLRFDSTGDHYPVVDALLLTIYNDDLNYIQLADDYDYGDTGGASGDHESTWVNLDDEYLKEDFDAGNEGWWILNFTIPLSPSGSWGGFHYATYARSFADWGEDPQIQFWDFVAEQWVKVDDYENDWAWHNGTISTDDYIGSENVTMRGFMPEQATYAGLLWCDYAELVFYDNRDWHTVPAAQMWFDIPDWNINNILEFFLPVAWSPEFQFGYDTFFIFLGLIMIPASTMYLARGGRKEMSMDKLFFGLVIFALGIGFLIGGILP